MNKRKVGREGPMYTQNNFQASASVRARTAAINVKIASVLDLISQATYIRSEKFKKQTPPEYGKGKTNLKCCWDWSEGPSNPPSAEPEGLE